MECCFCTDKLTYFTDARKLPCRHVACMNCLSLALNTFGKIACSTCSLELESADVSTLEPFKLDPGLPTLRATEDCHLCQDKKIADVFCVTCQMALCSSHKEEDQDCAESIGANEHYHVRIKQFMNNKENYKRHYCRIHHDKLTSQACVSCVQVFCASCDTQKKCSATNSEHKLGSLPDAVKVIKSHIEQLQAALTEALTRFESLEKEMARKMKLAEQEEECLIAYLNKAVREQVDHIIQESEFLKTRITKNFGDFKRQAEELREKLMTSTDISREKFKDLDSIKTISLDGLLLEKYSGVQNEIQHLTKVEYEPIRISCKQLIRTGRFRRLEVELADVPCSMRYINSVRTGTDFYYSVRWISADLLVAGTSDGMEIRDGELNLISSVRMGECADMVPYKNQLLVLQSLSQDARTITLYSNALKKIKDIVSMPTKSELLAQITAVDGFMAVTDPEKRCLCVYSVSGEHLHTIDLGGMANPKGVCISADGSVLVTDYSHNGSLRKYQLGGDYPLIWETVELQYPWGIVEHNSGLLYVNSCKHFNNTIYQLSPDGRLLKEFTCDQLNNTDDTHGMSVVGDSLAVACSSDGLKLFKFEYMQ